MNEVQSKPSNPQNASVPPASQADTADRCLKCNRQTPGAHYPFWVARRQTLCPHILHEEKVFICDRCAAARVRFAPLVVVLLWTPILGAILLFVGYWVMLDVRRVILGGRAFQIGMTLRFVLFLGMVFVMAALQRIAWRQLRAVRERLFHRPPYSSSVARLAIQLRKKELVRSLHLSASSALFLTEDEVSRARPYRGPAR
jgi:hypothetical protein